MTTWWRASRYTIRDDAIAPAELPVAAYSPWDLYEPVRGRHARAEGPHTELLEVVPEPQTRPENLTRSQTAGIVAWCNRYGLLGTLLHRVTQVVYPHYQDVLESGESFAEAISSTYTYTGAEWAERRFPNFEDDGHGRRTLDVVDPRLDAPSVLMRPGWSRFDSRRDRTPLRESLAGEWHRHFAGASEASALTHPYPPPGGLEFFEQYQEPLDSFLLGVDILRRALEQAGRAIDPHEEPGVRSRSLFLLNDLLGGVSPVASPATEGGTEPSWASPSLLGYLALMVQHDLDVGGRPRVCEFCGAAFIATGTRALFCSNRHRVAARRARLAPAVPPTPPTPPPIPPRIASDDMPEADESTQPADRGSPR